MNITTKHNYIMVTAVCAVAVILSISCVTKRETITEAHTDTIYNETHDTLVITQNKTDTIRDYQIITKTDTIRDVQTRVITLKESGDTIREVINNNVYHYVYQKDSTDKYQNKIDSLQKSISQLQQDKEKITENEKQVTVKEKSNPLKYWFFGGISTIGIVCVVFFVFKLIKFFK